MSTWLRDNNTHLNKPKQTCIVSPHEKGFWQADLYLDGWREGVSGDWFCTGEIGGTKSDIVSKVKESYPNAKFEDGITGICIDCGCEFFNLENECGDCGGIVGES